MIITSSFLSEHAQYLLCVSHFLLKKDLLAFE